MSKSIKLLLICSALLLIASLAQATSPLGAKEVGLPTQGVVVETMNAGGYTYLCLENNGVQAWAIIRETDVIVGEQVEIADGPVKANFTSESLNRTFDNLIFSRGIVRH